MLPEPSGTRAALAHYVTAIGYNKTENVIYFLHSWNGFPKVGGVSFKYWNMSPKSKYLVPYGMTVDEVLP